MTETEEADLKLRAETAEALLAAEREENERLRAELAVALGQKKPEPEKLEINRIKPGGYCEICADLEEKARRYREVYDAMSPPKPMSRVEQEFLERMMREIMTPEAVRPKVRVDRGMTRDEFTVVIRKSGYNVAFDIKRQDAHREEILRSFVRHHTRKAMNNLHEALDKRPASDSEVEWAYEEVMRQTRRAIGMR